jgi:hypothetical protein
MTTRGRITAVVCTSLLGAVALTAQAQQPQIPTLQVCNDTAAKGRASVKIAARADAQHQGTFDIAVELKCDASNPSYPAGTVQITNLSMTDSVVQGGLASTLIEQLTSTGKHTPTLYASGRCRADGVIGCRFWLLIADNRQGDAKGPDVVSFLVFNGVGQRVAYGTGPIVQGDIQIAPTSN